MGARFIGWGIAVPDRIVTNIELSETLPTSSIGDPNSFAQKFTMRIKLKQTISFKP